MKKLKLLNHNWHTLSLLVFLELTWLSGSLSAVPQPPLPADSEVLLTTPMPTPIIPTIKPTDLPNTSTSTSTTTTTTTTTIKTNLPPVNEDSGAEASRVFTKADVERIVNDLFNAKRTGLSSYNYKGVKYDINDFNKELVDYDKEIIDSMWFVESEKLAPGNERQTIENMIAKHHNNEELYQYLLDLSQKYPEVCRLYSIGESAQKKKLWVLEITEEPGKHKADKLEVKLVGNMHGNEVVGRELLLHLSKLLVENYRASQQEPFLSDKQSSGPKFVKKLLHKTRIHILPSMNPDGWDNSKEGCVYESPSQRGRINSRNFDLNRNFPDRVRGNKEDVATQPEVRAMMQWAKSIPFSLSANLHGGALVVSYGYDGNNNGTNIPVYTKAPDDDLLVHIAKTYAEDHSLMATNNTCYDECAYYHLETFPTGITNGAAWYPLYGGMQDWMYENTNQLEITVELGCDQYPKASELPKYWALNKRPLLRFLQQVHKGIRGIIRDSVSKLPLENVIVRVEGREKHDIKSASLGEYHRMLLEGSHKVAFIKDGYKSMTSNVFVHSGMPLIVDVDLEPINRQPSSTDGAKRPVEISPGSSTVEEAITLEPSDIVEGQHSLVVATLIMTIIITLILLAMVGAYVIQKRRFSRSQSVSIEMRPQTGRGTASTGISLSSDRSQQHKLPPVVSSGGGGGSSNVQLST